MPRDRKFHSIAALCGDGLRPELQALFERMAVQPSELFVREDGMLQSGPDPKSETELPQNTKPSAALIENEPSSRQRTATIRREQTGTSSTKANEKSK